MTEPIEDYEAYLDECYNKGRRDHFEGIYFEHNPFEEGSDAHEKWADGWLDAANDKFYFNEYD